MKKRILAMLMAAALCVSSVPFSVWAEEMETEVVTDSAADVMDNTSGDAAEQVEDAEVETVQEDAEDTEVKETETEVVSESNITEIKDDSIESSSVEENPESITETQEDEEINVESVDEIISADAMMEGSPSDIESGTYNGVDWCITEDYELIIGKEGETQEFSRGHYGGLDSWPWSKYSDKLTSATFSGRVNGNGRMSGMFYNCSSLTNLDVSGFDTSNVTDMGSMFRGCSSLTSLDVSGFNTDNAINMGGMFQNCSSLSSLDVSGFDTSNVTDMGHMFSDCLKLTSLDVSGFNTSNVANIWGMFFGCNSLQSLDVSGFDTSNVTSMSVMFSGCNSLQNLDVSGFDTSNVTNMSAMFNDCNGLTNLDVSGFDTNKVTDMASMFSDCNSLTSLDVSEFDTSSVTNMSAMFSGCSSLTSLDVSEFDTGNVTDMGWMFRGCSSLTNLDVSGFNTSNVSDMGWMFDGCKNLSSLDVSGFNTSNVSDMRWMFSGCYDLTNLDVSGFDTSKVTKMDYMFDGCRNLSSLDISGFDMSNVTDISFICNGCSSFEAISLPNTINNIQDNSFAGCSSLNDVYFTGSKEEWDAIKGNDLLPNNTTVYYNSSADSSTCNHNNEAITVKATPDKDGYINEKCSICGAEHISLIIGKPTVLISEDTIAFDGTEKKPSVKVTNTQQGDIGAENYDVEYSNNVNAGTAAVKVVFKGDRFEGSKELTFKITPVSISSKTVVLAASVYTYDGSAKKPAVTVNGLKTSDYTVSYANNTNAGTATVKIAGKGNYTGTIEKTFTINRANNPLTVKAKKPSVKYSKLNKKKQKIKAKKAFTVSEAQGKVTYKLLSVKKPKFKKYFKISKSGKITVKKGLKKGTYKLKVNVTAAGNANYEPLTKMVTVKIKVK